jgi:hypothetical protein
LLADVVALRACDRGCKIYEHWRVTGSAMSREGIERHVVFSRESADRQMGTARVRTPGKRVKETRWEAPVAQGSIENHRLLTRAVLLRCVVT